jgi:hypothetical protein
MVSSKPGTVVFCLAILVAGVAVAQDARLANPDGGFREFVHESSKVSGDVIMGVMLTDDAPLPGAQVVWTPRPKDASELEVCVKLTARDGLYEAENTYSIGAGNVGDTVRYPYGGNQEDILDDDFAVVRVTRGRCGSRPGDVLPAFWKTAPSRDVEALRVYLNTAGNPASAFLDDGSDFWTDCTVLASENALKYTTLCTLPLEHFVGSNVYTVTILVSRNRTEERFSFTLDDADLRP